MRDLMDIIPDDDDVEIPDAFGTTDLLYHGTQVEHLWAIIQSDMIECDHYSDSHFMGVSLSRSFDVARRHGESDEESMMDTFYDYFDIPAPKRVEFGGAVMEFERSKINKPIEHVDDLGNGVEEEERVHGNLPLRPSLKSIYVNPRGLELFFSEIERGRRECSETMREEFNRCYGDDYRKIVHFLRTSPMMKTF